MTAVLLATLFAHHTMRASGGSYTVNAKQAPYSFVSPSGKPFWSFGVCCTDLGTPTTQYDVSNPSYSALRIFPSTKAWVQDSLLKLKSWQFNSLGGWSDHETFNRYGGKDRMPYFVVLHLGAFDHAPWSDLFSPKMEKAVDDAARKQIAKVGKDPLLVGYFTDNELGWWDDTLFITYLAMPPSAPGKRRMMSLMRAHYRNDFKALCKDWITSSVTFDALAKEGKMKLREGGNGMQFCNAWLYDLGVRYYKLMRKTILKYDKNHLILGDRYCQYFTLPIVQASKNFVDAASTNYGAEWNDGQISHFFLDTLHQATGKPVIITEFYMCATENRSGNKNSSGGFPIVQTQSERAAAFRTYVESLALRPYVIGAHWFQFADEPAHGRGDGENYNMGLVDTSGRPYEEVTQAASRIDFATLRHRSKQTRTSRLTATQAPIEVMRSLKLWDKNRSFVPAASPSPIGDLYVSWDSNHIYIGVMAMDYMDETLYVGNTVPEGERSKLAVSILGLANPVTIRFGGHKRKPSCSDPSVLVSEVPALKHTIILKIPVSRALNKGDRIEIKAELATHSRGESIAWNSVVKLTQ